MKTARYINVFFWSVMAICMMLSGQNVYAGIAGNVQFVNGQVQIINSAGQARIMQKNDAINESDTVITSGGAFAQIKMLDGGYIMVRPNSELKFDSFVFSGSEDGNERSFFSLLRGGIRAITGLIGHRYKKNYLITTPDSTIGIRGTDHETIVVTPGSPWAALAPVGTYNKVNRGGTTLKTAKGAIDIQPNQMGFAASSGQIPVLQPLNLKLFTVTPAPSLQALNGKNQAVVRGASVVDSAVQGTDAVPADTLQGSQIKVPITGRSGPSSPALVF